MINVVLIDLDGTLVDSVAGIHLACSDMARQLRLEPPSVAFVRQSIGQGADALIERVLKEISGETADPVLRRRARQIYDEAYLERASLGTKLRPFAEQALDVLMDLGCDAIIATNKPGPAASAIIEHLDLGERVTSIVTPDSAGVRKPDPAFVRAALEGRAVSQAMLIGDSVIDAETARRADIPFIAMTGGYNAGIPINDSEIGKSVMVECWTQVPAKVSEVLRRAPVGFAGSD